MIDGLVLSGGVADVRRARVRRRARHGARRHAGGAATRRWRATPDARAAFIVSPTYYGMAADVAGLRRGRARRRRPARRRPGVGPALRLPPGAAAVARSRSAPTRCSPRRTRSSARSRSRRCCTSRRPAAIDPDAVARAVRLVRSTSPELAADGLARRRAPPARRSTARRCWRGTIAAAARAREAIDAVAGLPRRRASELVGRPGVAGWDPLRIVIDVRGTGCTRLRGRRRAARRPTTSTSSSPRTRRSCSCSASASRPSALERFAHDFAATVAADRAAGRPAEALVRAAGALEQRGRRAAARGVPRRGRGRRRSTTRSAASRPSRSPATRRASRRCCRASGSPPRSSPTCASWPRPGARLHGASDPAFETITVLRDARAAAGRPAPRADPCRDVPADATLDELVARALAEDVGDGDVTDRGDRRRGRARDARRSPRRRPASIYGLDVAEAGVPRARPRARESSGCAGGRVARAGGPVLRVRGRRARAADRRAHRAELPRPAVRASRR